MLEAATAFIVRTTDSSFTAPSILRRRLTRVSLMAPFETVPVIGERLSGPLLDQRRSVYDWKRSARPRQAESVLRRRKEPVPLPASARAGRYQRAPRSAPATH